jgi:hypothetical protein
MIDKTQLLLLRDLTNLLLKYGSQTFNELSDSLSSSEITQELSTILSGIAKATPPTSPRIVKTVTKKTSIPRALTLLQSTDPQKYQTILELYRDLEAKTILPTLRNIQEFASDQGLIEINTKSRKKAIPKLITILTMLPNERLPILIQRANAKREKDTNRSLDSWSKLILKQK